MDAKNKTRELWSTDDLRPIAGLREYHLPERGPSIYFLSNYGEVVYVGQSIDLTGRIAAHRHAMRFDRIHYFRLSGQDSRWLTEVESAFIKTIRPSFNMTCKKSDVSARQKELLDKYCGGASLSPSFGWESK